MKKEIYVRRDNGFMINITVKQINPKGNIQWCIKENKDDANYQVLEGQTKDNIILSNTMIKRNCNNKWLCYKRELLGKEYFEDCIQLSSKFINIIRNNQFDYIGFFGEDGNIREDIGYKKEKL